MISFKLKDVKAKYIKIKFIIFVTKNHTQRVSIHLNDNLIDDSVYTSDYTEKTFYVEHILKAKNLLKIQTPDAISPKN